MRISVIIVSGIASGAALIGLSACGTSGDQPASGDAQGVKEVASEMKKIALQPGEWETTSEIIDVQMEGAPQGMPAGALDAMKGRTTTVKKCVTPEEAANPDADFLTAQKDSQCTYSGFEMANGAIKGNVSCPGEHGSTANVAMEGIYTSDSYAMTMNMDAAGIGDGAPAGMKMRMKMKISGKRIGECPA